MALVDRKSGEVRLFPPSALFPLRPTLSVTVPLPDSRAGDDLDQRRQLVEMFGSAKSQTKLRQAINNRMTVDNVHSKKTIVDTIAAKAELEPSVSDVAKSVDATRNVPEFDVDAEEPVKVYPLKKIVPPEQWTAIDVKTLLSMAKSPLAHAGEAPSCVLNLLLRCSALGTDKKALTRHLKILQYLTYLLRLIGTRKIPKPSELAELLQAPEIIAEALYSAYVVRGKIPPKKMDLARSTAMVLALTASDFDLDTTFITKDLKLAVPRSLTFFRELGCKIVKIKDSGLHRARLVVPLTFPVMRLGKKKR